MNNLKTDTLGFHLGVRQGFQPRDHSKSGVPEVVRNLNEYMTTTNHLNGLPLKASPDQDALVFYMLNHAVSIIRKRVGPVEPLGQYLPVVEAYGLHVAQMATRMFFYMLLICTRESRHVRDYPNSNLAAALLKAHGASACNFHKGIIGLGSSTAASKLRDNPPKTNLGRYTNLLCDVFFKGKFSSAYGGPAWGAVAKVLRDYATGVISAELMMDTAFTLCHNHGPIFNKGMLFDNYTPEIYKILDVQRSGQIPQLVANKETTIAKHSLVTHLWTECHKVIGEEFSGPVDWYKVEELGSLKSYPDQKAAQLKLYGKPKSSPAGTLASHFAEEIDMAIKAKEAAKWLEILPGTKVKLVEIDR